VAETELTAEDYVKSLTGFDEIAIARAFDGADMSALSKRPSTLLRACVFVDQRRKGLRDPEAYQAALTLTLDELEQYFPDAEDEVMPEEPVTAQGEDDAPSS
jgi:hypothetical protein